MTKRDRLTDVSQTRARSPYPPETVILLDLNYTLVANSLEKKRPFTAQIDGELYRQWLIELVRPYCVVLITARPEMHRHQTIARIDARCRWRPALACFNETRQPPPATKRHNLHTVVFPSFGTPDETPYLAIESNPRTRAMYLGQGIPSIYIKGDTPWDSLPLTSTSPATSGNSTRTS